MSDNDQQLSTDLFEGSSSSDTSAVAGDGTEKEPLLGEENQTGTPEKEKKAADSSAVVQRQKQVDAWVSKGRDALKDLPADKEWLRPHIEARFSAIDKEPEMDKIIEQKLAQKESDKRFQNLKESLRSMKLKGDQQTKLQARFDKLVAAKMPRDEALEIAAEAAGISLDPEEQNRLITRQRMALPIQGTGSVQDSDPKPDDPDFHKKVTDPKAKMRILMQHMRSPN